MVTKLHLPRRRFTVDQYHRMVKAGILTENDRVELIEGEIIDMAAVGDRHVACVFELNRIFSARLAERVWVSVQSPIHLTSTSEPEPDIALLRLRPDRYRSGLPRADDVLLLIEVSDTTLAYDRGIKLRLYALAGIPEVWIVDLRRRRLLVFREPNGSNYRSAEVVTAGRATPAAFPDVDVSLDDIVG